MRQLTVTKSCTRPALFHIRTGAVWSPVSCFSPVKRLWQLWESLENLDTLLESVWFDPSTGRASLQWWGQQGMWGSSSCPGFELSAARCGFSSQGFLGDSHMCSEVTMFLSPLKMLSLHFSVPGAEPEFRTEAGQSPGNQVLQWPGWKCSHGWWAPFGYSCSKSRGSHLEVIGMMYWSTASIPGAPDKRRMWTF